MEGFFLRREHDLARPGLCMCEMRASVDACSQQLARSMQGVRLCKGISILPWPQHLLERMVLNQPSCWTHACFVGFRTVLVVALASCSTGRDMQRKQELESTGDGELIIVFSPKLLHHRYGSFRSCQVPGRDGGLEVGALPDEAVEAEAEVPGS